MVYLRGFKVVVAGIQRVLVVVDLHLASHHDGDTHVGAAVVAAVQVVTAGQDASLDHCTVQSA